MAQSSLPPWNRGWNNFLVDGSEEGRTVGSARLHLDAIPEPHIRGAGFAMVDDLNPATLENARRTDFAIILVGDRFLTR
jgi:hypothetical protein